MNEHELTQALEPIFDELETVNKRLESLAREPGPPGKDVDVNDVVRLLKADAEFLQTVQGSAGDDARPEDVAAILKSDRELIAALKAEPIRLDELIDELVGTHAEQLRGKDGKAPTAADVAAELTQNKAFLDAVTPPAATPGEPGEPGQDGAGIDAPAHVAGKVYREGVTVTAHLGQFYRAKTDTAAMPGDSEDWQRLGTGGFRWCGLKPASLNDGDVYIDGGSLFCTVKGKGVMWVQRPKPAAYLKTMEINGSELVARMSNGESVTCEIGNVAELAEQAEEQHVNILVILEELKQLRKELAELRESVEVDQ